ncbi:phosphocholine-specific phospholipase C [Paracidovorax oryzae]|uniref:phosphocholine-specific phospholipase C n=1 Tax=Paracidovorax oryzae TaxID=862720 RepID=UPI0004967F92|nr:phospholipase C, phosphocholine-specific [Paracidovorax oryzae]
MSGKPAARQGDLTKKGGPIVQGSATVLVGSAGGVACAVCPGGMAVGHPVNPALGAKVLTGADELDFALPGPLPLAWQRVYGSYVNAEHGAACGLLGYGWKLPLELRLRLESDRVVLFDASGRVITFDEALQPGQALYSSSEDLWLLRGGDLAGSPAPSSTPAELLPWAQQPRWSHVPAVLRADPGCVIAVPGAGGAGAPAWVFLPAGASGEGSAAGHVLHAVIDRFGRSQRYQWGEEGLSRGHIVGITDGTGRRYALRYERIVPDATAARSLGRPGRPDESVHARHPLLGPDDGVRLVGVDCTFNPLDPAVVPGAAPRPQPLVGYRYDGAGNLAEVLGADGTVLRRFGYDALHRMTEHQVRQGPQHRYVYEDQTAQGRRQGLAARPGARVAEQHNEEGLSYFFEYSEVPPSVGDGPAGPARSSTVVRDSLGRTTAYHFEGEGGLKRLVRLVAPDGAEQGFRYDSAGRRLSATDALGRTTWWRYDGAGRLLGVVIVMQENRSFDHYFGTLAGVRGFGDRFTIPLPGGRNVWQQFDANGKPVLPYHLDQAAGNAQRVRGTPHSWVDARNAWDRGRMSEWPRYKQPQSMGYYMQTEASFQFALANAFTVCDAYFCSLHGGTNTNRLFHMTGTNGAGGPSGQVVVNNEWDELDSDTDLNAGSYDWTTYPERLQKAGVSWMVYQNMPDNFTDNPLVGFRQYRQANLASGKPVYSDQTVCPAYDPARDDAGNPLYKGIANTMSDGGFLGSFSQAVLNGTLPQVSWIIPPATYSEHPGPSSPVQGGWYVQQVLDALTANPDVWSKTVLLINFDENDGYFDHLPPPCAPSLDGQGGTLGKSTLSAGDMAYEYYTHKPVTGTSMPPPDGDCYGPGPRVPMWVISPWSRGGWVNSQNFDHTSVLRFLEARFGVKEPQISPYRRAMFGDLTSALNFATPNDAPLATLGGRRTRSDADALRAAQAGQLDPMGRMLHQDWRGLRHAAAMPAAGDTGDSDTGPTSAAGRIAPALGPLSTLAQRRYWYDPLGQLVGVQTPGEATRYAYDAWQRLSGLHRAGQGTPEVQAHWTLDAAGNRLPAPPEARVGAPNAERQAWAREVRDHLQDPDFDLLRPGARPGEAQGPVTHWPGNRIGWSTPERDGDGHGTPIRYRYDAFGNRVQALHADGRAQRLRYDALHQLREVWQREGTGGAWQRVACYRYDPFGRRLAKTVIGDSRYNHGAAPGSAATTHAGWDGDRLVHIEGPQGLQHTLYEPDSFVPLLRLERDQAIPTPVQAMFALENQGGESHAAALFAGWPRAQREWLEQALNDALGPQGDAPRSRLQAGLPEATGALLSAGLRAVRQQRQDATQAHATRIRHVLCDHLGTPIALVDANGPQAGLVTWAATYHAWGAVREEYDPHGIGQDIRFQGQQFDAETGLHYNRFRHYDPLLGQYVTQDPIGLMGGSHSYAYVGNDPLNWVDPRGLEPGSMAQRGYLDNNRPSYPGLLGQDENGVLLFDEKNPNFHSYNVSNSCQKTTPGCTFGNVAEGLMRYPAPGASGEPIKNKQSGFAFPVGPVTHVVSPDRSMVTNITEKSHLLYPGIVRRWVSESANEVTVHTYGEGVGPMGKMNNALADWLWGKVDKDVFKYAESCK